MAPQQANCPHCGTPMVWSHVNQQYYCNRCEIFIQANAPLTTFDNVQREINGSGRPVYASQNCPRCGRPMTFIGQYNRWYCYPCRQYG